MTLLIVHVVALVLMVGLDYFRRGFMHSKDEDYIDLSETIEVDEKDFDLYSYEVIKDI